MHAFEQQKESLTDSQLEGKVHVTSADLAWALKEVRPSAMREVEIDIPKVSGFLRNMGLISKPCT